MTGVQTCALPICWNLRFDEVIKGFGFVQTYGEACIYKKVSGSSIAFLILYVDDILLIGNDVTLLESVKSYLNKSFSMKDFGEAAYILGIKIYRDRSKRLIGLSQMGQATSSDPPSIQKPQSINRKRLHPTRCLVTVRSSEDSDDTS